MKNLIAGFDWDNGNVEKCQKHGVSRFEIEELFHRTVMLLPDGDHSNSHEQRFRAIGTTQAGRYIFVVFTMRALDGQMMIRPISARYMHRKEVDLYEQENPTLQERRRG